MEKLPEISSRPAIRYDYFPTLWQAVLFRCWAMVPHDRIARVLKTDEETLKKEAARMGLDAELVPDPEWLRRGYLTIIRETWHLVSFEEMTGLLGITEEYLAFLLKEDDFLWHKLGKIKPLTGDVSYAPLTEEQAEATGRMSKIVNDAFPAGICDNAFDFARSFMRPLTDAERAEAKKDIVPGDTLRTVYSYFALYGDPLADPSLDPFPEALLAEYARMGVKGVWLQGVLYQLVEFPFDKEISTGWEKRIESLNQLVQRAKQYDIGVYLYLNEPRSMGAEFFEKYPHLKGSKEDSFYAMCISMPEVKEYLEDAVYRLFSSVPDLAGFFTITMSENLTNCISRTPDGPVCPRCAARKPEEIIAEVNNLMARGAKRANPRAKAVAWNWAWGNDWACRVPDLLTEGQIVQCTSEERLSTTVGGVQGEVQDYTMSIPGPGPKSKKVWQAALDAGHEVCAKTQFNNTWEMSAAPWIPVFDKVAEHVNNLRAAGVKHYQMSWTLGGYPSPNLKLAGFLSDGRGTVKDFLCQWLGDDLGCVADEGQKKLSEAFACFPFNIGVLYVAPQNYGPMEPLFLEKTGWKATMIGFPYDDLDGWRAIYPREIFEKQFRLLMEGWREGVEILRTRQGESTEYDDLLRMAEAALCHFTSTWHLIAFVLARDAQNREEMLRLVRAERENVLKMISLRQADSRLGYEASNHYYYTMGDLAEKLINLDSVERRLS